MTKYGRKSKRHTEAFKKRLVKDAITNEVGVSLLEKRYGVSQTSIYRWLDKYGSEYIFDIGGKKSKGEMKEEEAELSDYPESLSQSRIKELEEELRVEKMRNEGYKKLIELAEEEHGISIAKKYGTKQFKK